jgi:predicted N-acetyltransferase YhbS
LRSADTILNRAARFYTLAGILKGQLVVQIVPITDFSTDAVEQLLDRAFGTDRHIRTAYRIREGVTALDALSFAAVEDGTLIGTIQCWPIALNGDDGRRIPLVMLGPVAVEPIRQQFGIGRMLTNHALAIAEADPASPAMMLIGDPEYYGRFFSFTSDQTAGWRTPGPVERHRILARGPNVPGGSGLLAPRIVAPAFTVTA